jgi:hypothetical protein
MSEEYLNLYLPSLDKLVRNAARAAHVRIERTKDRNGQHDGWSLRGDPENMLRFDEALDRRLRKHVHGHMISMRFRTEDKLHERRRTNAEMERLAALARGVRDEGV